MIKFHRILLLTLVAVFLASAAGVARYAADSCTQRIIAKVILGSLPNLQWQNASKNLCEFHSAQIPSILPLLQNRTIR